MAPRYSERLKQLRSSSTTSPSSFATINFLAPETIAQIIQTAYIDDPTEESQRKARRHFLLDTSLVCRTWTPFAQEALWRVVRLDSSEQVLSFVAARPGRCPVQTLSILDSNAAAAPSLELLLRNVRGVQALALEEIDSFDVDWICGSNLRDLKSLRLFACDVSTSTSTPILPFALTYLDLKWLAAAPKEFLDALSRQSSITSHTLYSSQADELDQLSPLLTHLESLELFTHDERAAEDYLRPCTHLRHLTLSSYHSGAIVHLVSPLTSLKATHCLSDCVATLLDILDSNTVGVAKLGRLVVRVVQKPRKRLEPMVAAQQWPRWSELSRVCKDRGIELIVERAPL